MTRRQRTVKGPCPYCGDRDQSVDSDRETRPMWVCDGCGLTVEEAVVLAAERETEGGDA